MTVHHISGFVINCIHRVRGLVVGVTLILTILLSHAANGQSEAYDRVSLSLASSSSGNNWRLGYEFGIHPRFRILTGLKYFDGQALYKMNAESNVYVKQFYGQNFMENLGLFTTFDLTVIQNIPHGRVYTKLDLQANNTRLTGNWGGQSTGYLTDPFINWEALLAAGIEAEFLENLFIFVDGGVGLLIMHMVPPPFYETFATDWSVLLQIGIKYQLAD